MSGQHPHVGVLLPVRLETRFYPPNDGGGWRLRVLVVPDEPWIDRHDPLAFEAELAAVERMWQVSKGDLTTDTGRVAWRTLAEQHGGARAAWLAREFPPLIATDGSIHIARPAEMRTPPRFSQISGFPDALEFWITRGGAPSRIATTAVKTDRLRLDFPDPDDPGDARWWSSWQEAQDVGVGIEVDLGAAIPDDIGALFVTGLGTAPSAALFAAHRDSGALGVIEPGTPTNSVDGAPAAALGRDPETWRQIALAHDVPGINSRSIGQALTGKPDGLGALPGDTFDHRQTNGALTTALWPVLWGHALKDIWGLGNDVHGAGLWAAENVLPEGPLPPIRINDQPYGLLPATALRDWQPDGRDPRGDRIEGALHESLLRARRMWAAASEATGNVAGVDTERLLELLGHTSSSNAYAYRTFLPLDLLHLLYVIYDRGMAWPELVRWWQDLSRGILAFPVDPQRLYASQGWPHDLRIPLVAPDDVPPETRFGEWLAQSIRPELLVEASPSFWLDVERGQTPSERLPDSLLARLLLHARFVMAAEVRRIAQKVPPSALEPLSADQEQRTRLADDARLMTPAELQAGGTAVDLHEAVRKAIALILALPIGELERVFRATLDTAAYRIDPWAIAYAWRRLQQETAATHEYRLGVYGWVDAPGPGSPGPTEGGLLHAPSEQQALAAVILRDKAIHDPETGRWQIDLESSTIRLAEQIAEEVRLGSHIGEVLGRHVERIAGSKATVEALRTQFPLRTEHAGRRVCNGEAILKADPAALPLSATQSSALAPLRRALDTYSDLLVAEAVFHVVSGRGAVAGAAMEAAAGLASPPDLDVISTRRTGRAINTNVVVALANAPNPSIAADTSPGTAADPAVAAFLDSALGPPAGQQWTWEVLEPGGTIATISLDDFALAAVDAVVLSEEELARLVLGAATDGSILNGRFAVRRPDGTKQSVRLSDLGLAPGEIVLLTERALHERILATAPEGSTVEGPDAPAGLESQRRARRIIDVLGSQPALPADLLDTGESASDTAVRTELHARYERLHQIAGLARDALQLAAASSDETELRGALRRAARWGITPATQAEETLGDRVARAHDALDQRLGNAPVPAEVGGFAAHQIATLIAELAAPEGQLAVMSRIDLDAWPTAFVAAPGLDEDWLAVTAAVRPPLARLEAHQIEGALGGAWPSFSTWSNRAGDPWQLSPDLSPNGEPLASRLIAMYGPVGTLPTAGASAVALGLLDSWGETVPDVDQSTTAAFGFNAPAARAPQAILLAVAPVEGEPLTSETLAAIVAETRELAHARMATPRDLRTLDAALPLAMLPASGITAVQLEARP
jgi:hypothetical protein